MTSIYLTGRTDPLGVRGFPAFAQSFHVDGGGVFTVTLATRATSFAITDSNSQLVASGRTEVTPQPVLARLAQGTYHALILQTAPDDLGRSETTALWEDGAEGEPPSRVVIPGKPAADGIPAVPDMCAILTPGRQVALTLVPSLSETVPREGIAVGGTLEPALGSDQTRSYFLDFSEGGTYAFALNGPNLSYSLQDQDGAVVAAGSNGSTPAPDSLAGTADIQPGAYTLLITADSSEGERPWSLAITPVTTNLQDPAPSTPTVQSLPQQSNTALQAKFDRLAGQGGQNLPDYKPVNFLV